MNERSLETEAQFLKGVGPRGAVSLAKAGLSTVRDVLYYLPRRYEDRRNTPPIRSLRPGMFATILGRVTRFEGRPMGRRGMVRLKVSVSDSTGTIALTWFNQPWIRRQFEGYDGEIVAYGQIKEADWGLEITNPEWEKLDASSDPEDFARIVPVYPLVDGLAQSLVRRAARSAVAGYLGGLSDPIPAKILKENNLRDLAWCLREIHEPQSDATRLEARRRLVFEEFLYLQVALAMRRAETQQELGIAFPIDAILRGDLVETGVAASKSWSPNASHTATLQPATLFQETQETSLHGEPLWDQIHRILPFDLTGAQRRVIGEIWEDMKRPHPMNRLVQGDVGSGKTAVAACAMLAAIRSGYQAALMAPTEILAEQHHANLAKLFEPLGIEVALLVGKLSASQKKRAAQSVSAGECKLAVGTHALIQEGIEFKRLGLVVIDEQHRFGVLQRAALREKGAGNPDVLVMTATPIPRTLTMTLYGDLEYSKIDELPPGRKPIKTYWKNASDRDSVYEGVLKLVESGRQAYFVCPMVSESEKTLALAAEDLAYRLANGPFASKRVGLLHGQMKPAEKEATMAAFRASELDILVSTTVIEVGVDVPNASVMVIEDANRFGLSQLHQLRGRVGRGAHQSYCLLVADAKTDDAIARMEIMARTSDGFEIAEEDLRLRGPGELAGTKQSGNLDFKIADLVQDGLQLEVARQSALRLIERDPTLSQPENRGLILGVRARLGQMATVAIS